VNAQLADPIAHYDFDGTINDNSVNNWTTTMHGGSPSYVQGRFGQAVHLDGGNDWIGIQHDGSLNFETASEPFTIALSVKADRHDRQQALLLDRGGNNVAISYSMQLRPRSNSDASVGNWGGFRGSGFDIYTPVADVFDNWHHLAAVSDPQQGKMFMYVDGEPTSEVLFGNVDSTVNTTNTVMIGGYYGAYGYENWFKGAIDGVRIYDRALSAAEVQQLVPAALGPPVSASVGQGGIGLNETDPLKFVDLKQGKAEVRFAPITSGGLIEIRDADPDFIECYNKVVRTYAAMHASVTMNNPAPDAYQAQLRLSLSEEDLADIYAKGYTEDDLRIYMFTSSLPSVGGFPLPSGGYLPRTGWTDDLMEEMENMGYSEPDSVLGHWGYDPLSKSVWGNFETFSAYAISIVPEPTTLSMLALAGLAVLRRRRKQ